MEIKILGPRELGPAGLQWGHPFARMEISKIFGGVPELRAASMGPSFCKDGNYNQNLMGQLYNVASMGPSFCKDGNLKFWEGQLPELLTLQWGHPFARMEIILAAEGGKMGQAGFNGAILLQGWKFFVTATFAQSPHASMGPSFCKDGNLGVLAWFIREDRASMGPSFCKDGNERSR